MRVIYLVIEYYIKLTQLKPKYNTVECLCYGKRRRRGVCETIIFTCFTTLAYRYTILLLCTAYVKIEHYFIKKKKTRTVFVDARREKQSNKQNTSKLGTEKFIKLFFN